MPAILRIFVYQIVASHTVIGSTPSYDQGVDLSDSMVIWNNMRCLTLGWSLQNLQVVVAFGPV